MSVITIYPVLEILKEEDSKAAVDRFRTRVTAELHRQIVTVEFVKKDGALRKMCCTLSVNGIPADELQRLHDNNSDNDILSESHEPGAVNNLRQRKINTDVRTVYDVEVGAWRSFRWDSVKSVTYNSEVM
jgi:hypothetical protein